MSGLGRDFAREQELARGSQVSRRPSKLDDIVREMAERNQKKARAIVPRKASDIVEEPVPWLWLHNMAFGFLQLFDGMPKCGKSTILMDLAARASTGAPWPNQTADTTREPLDVLWLSQEEVAKITIKARLRRAGANMERVMVLDMDDEISLPDDFQALDEMLGKYKFRLVCVDSLSGILTLGREGYNDNVIKSKIMKPLARLAMRHNACIVLIRHLTKGDSTNAMTRGQGSIGIMAQARVAHLVEARPGANKTELEHKRVMAGIGSNLGPMPRSLTCHFEDVDGVARVVWEEDERNWFADDLLSGSDREAASRPKRAEMFLELTLGQAGAAGILRDDLIAQAEAQGMSRASIDRARQRLGDNGLTIRGFKSPEGFRYSLSEANF